MNGSILIQGSNKKQTQYLIGQLQGKTEDKVNGYDFYKGVINGVSVIVSDTKVGTINTAVSTIVGINAYKPKVVLNIGTADGHNASVHKGNIVVAQYAINANSYMADNSTNEDVIHQKRWKLVTYDEITGQIKDERGELVPSNLNLVTKAEILIKTVSKNDVYVGTVISSDMWSKEADRIDFFSDNFNSMCEDMSTYASSKVCNDNNIPFLGLRMISSEDPTDDQYENYACEEIQRIVTQILPELVKDIK